MTRRIVEVHVNQPHRFQTFQEGMLSCVGQSLEIASDLGDGSAPPQLALRIQTVQGPICYMVEGPALLDAVREACGEYKAKTEVKAPLPLVRGETNRSGQPFMPE